MGFIFKVNFPVWLKEINKRLNILQVIFYPPQKEN